MAASQLQAIIDALPDPVIALSRQATVLAANKAARAIAPALRDGEPVSLSLRTPALVRTVQQALASGQAQRVRFESKQFERWYEVHVIPASGLESLPGARGVFLLTLHDLTPLRRAEAVRADFIANASHELRTPLAALSGFIDTLRGSARDDPNARERFLDIMQAQARRMARLVDDLLSLSRVELSEHIAPEGSADLGALVRHVVDALQTLAAERDVEVFVAPPPQPVIVRGDWDELVRVFENLVENALKYGASGKRVEIGLDLTPANARGRRMGKVSVRDYGPGIAPEHLPRLSERFYRVDVGLSRAEGGTGLGLALAKHIVNRHRGKLVIESELGAGSTFTVLLPLANGDGSGQDRQPETGERGRNV